MQSSKKPLALSEIKKRRTPIIDVNTEFKRRLSRMDKIALYITQRVGTIGFFLIIFAWTTLWLGWNILAPESLKFDPPMGFVFWLFISNLIQILLMPLIMVGQNIQGKHAETRSESDLRVNIRAEKEIEAILQHLEYQNELLLSITLDLKKNNKTKR